MRSTMIYASVLLGACASAPSEKPAVQAARVFSYSLSAPTTGVYSFVDSSAFTVSGGAMGEVRATIGTIGTAEVAYAPSAAGVEATIRITELAGAMSNSAMGGGPSVKLSDVDGQAVVTVNSRGVARTVSLPKMSTVAQQVGINAGFFRRFFARLPAGPIARGASWVDTVNVTDESVGWNVHVVDVVTTTFVRDTALGGRTLAVLMTTAQRSLDAQGTTQGVQIAQKLTGTVNGQVLWDPQRHMLAERVETSQLSGTFDMPQMGQTGMPVTARSNSRVSLR